MTTRKPLSVSNTSNTDRPPVEDLIECAFQACNVLLDERPEIGSRGNSEVHALIQKAYDNIEDAAGIWYEQQEEAGQADK